jgi:hypothetical protein
MSCIASRKSASRSSYGRIAALFKQFDTTWLRDTAIANSFDRLFKKAYNNAMRLSLGLNGFEVYAIPIEVSMLLETRLRQWCSGFRINVAEAKFEFMTKESRSTE